MKRESIVRCPNKILRWLQLIIIKIQDYERGQREIE